MMVHGLFLCSHTPMCDVSMAAHTMTVSVPAHPARGHQAMNVSCGMLAGMLKLVRSCARAWVPCCQTLRCCSMGCCCVTARQLERLASTAQEVQHLFCMAWTSLAMMTVHPLHHRDTTRSRKCLPKVLQVRGMDMALCHVGS
jgi:hypothetical protein